MTPDTHFCSRCGWRGTGEPTCPRCRGKLVEYVADGPITQAAAKLGHDSGIEDEGDFLRAYRKQGYPKPSVTVDMVIFTIVDGDLKVLLIERVGHPFRGHPAIPGGFVHVGDGFDDQGESLDAAAARELQEETGLDPAQHGIYLEQLYTFGEPYRDPRMRIISVAYYALVPSNLVALVRPGSDARTAKWVSVHHEMPLLLTPLAFDHERILNIALERIQGKIDYTPLAFNLLPPTFTIAELQEVYEAIKGTTYDRGNFRRRFRRMQTDGLLVEAPGKRRTATKPAKVYRFVS